MTYVVLSFLNTPVHFTLGLASESEMRQLYSTSELMPHELQKLNWPNKKNEEKRTASWNWWVPSVWASRLVRDAYDKGYVDSRENLEAIYKVRLREIFIDFSRIVPHFSRSAQGDLKWQLLSKVI